MSKTAFKHFILTRFNVPVDDWKTAKDGALVLSDEWLSHRFGLFEGFCLPSVTNQSNQDFQWLVFFGSNTPEKFKKRIQKIHHEYGNFQPIFIDNYGELLPSILREINSRISGETTHIITSRMDNDDSIHRQYVQIIQDHFDGQHMTAVDIPDGYNLSIEPDVRMGKTTAPFNPFISLIEKVSDFKTVLSRQHAHWIDHTETISIDNKRLWLQIIHHKNMVNTYRGNLLGSFLQLHSDFGIPQHIVDSFPRQHVLGRVIANTWAGIYLMLRKVKQVLYQTIRPGQLHSKKEK